MSYLTKTLRDNRSVAVFLTFFLIIFALLFLFIAVTKLNIIERDALFKAKTLIEARKQIITIPENQVNEIHENQLIHLTGELITNELLTDPLFQLNANAIQLRRIVKMYQWQERMVKNEKGIIEAIYEKTWSSDVINSEQFQSNRYPNPKMLLNSQSFTTKQLQLGDFILSADLINKMDHYQPLALTDLFFWKAQKNLQNLLPNHLSHLKQGNYYIGENLLVPQIGDLSISFEIIPLETVSIIAKQVQSTLTTYQTQIGGDILLLEYGIVSPNTLFRNVRIALFLEKFKQRVFVVLILFLGMYSLFMVLWLSKSNLPLVGDPANLRGWLLSLMISLVLTLLFIGLTWKDHNVMIGYILLFFSLFGLYFLKYVVKKTTTNLTPETIIPSKIN